MVVVVLLIEFLDRILIKKNVGFFPDRAAKKISELTKISKSCLNNV